ncbi:MAG: hypothetical protein ABIO70_21685 [Pseudomonadota bacterium]
MIAALLLAAGCVGPALVRPPQVAASAQQVSDRVEVCIAQDARPAIEREGSRPSYLLVAWAGGIFRGSAMSADRQIAWQGEAPDTGTEATRALTGAVVRGLVDSGAFDEVILSAASCGLDVPASTPDPRVWLRLENGYSSHYSYRSVVTSTVGNVQTTTTTTSEAPAMGYARAAFAWCPGQGAACRSSTAVASVETGTSRREGAVAKASALSSLAGEIAGGVVRLATRGAGDRPSPAPEPRAVAHPAPAQDLPDDTATSASDLFGLALPPGWGEDVRGRQEVNGNRIWRFVEGSRASASVTAWKRQPGTDGLGADLLLEIWQRGGWRIERTDVTVAGASSAEHVTLYGDEGTATMMIARFGRDSAYENVSIICDEDSAAVCAAGFRWIGPPSNGDFGLTVPVPSAVESAQPAPPEAETPSSPPSWEETGPAPLDEPSPVRGFQGKGAVGVGLGAAPTLGARLAVDAGSAAEAGLDAGLLLVPDWFGVHPAYDLAFAPYADLSLFLHGQRATASAAVRRGVALHAGLGAFPDDGWLRLPFRTGLAFRSDRQPQGRAYATRWEAGLGYLLNPNTDPTCTTQECRHVNQYYPMLWWGMGIDRRLGVSSATRSE